ncbi:MAG: ParB/RepB/Spo0J family partition protein [Alphaproteobacteria bacterium]|nr:ParB/RepB/Spo0J family partition protein [Alphaproteobacteria bacterium]MBR0213055.1 ParB/RepB/Spo0J family partition protein [Alphaproteobacteria bacterium]
MASKFLGKSLAQLNEEMGQIPDISVLTGGERTVIKPIPLVQISPNPDQPRKTFDEHELQELADSIKKRGVLSPIILRSVQNKPYLYEIVAGERRFRAAKLANLSEIPAIVRSLDDKNAMEIALIENVQRENLNPVEEAEGYKNLMEKCHYKLEDVSKFIGKSESYIRNLMRINSLPDSVKQLIKEGKISASHARTIAVSDNPEQLAHDIVNNKLSVAETQKHVKNSNRSKKSRSFTQNTLDRAYVEKIENKLSKHLGTDVVLREKRGGAGQFIISFSNRVQMEDLINKLSK